MSDTNDVVEELAEDIEYPAFHPSIIPVQVDENTLHIRGGPWSGPIFTIQDLEREDTITRLADLVDGETHVSEILEEYEDEEQREEIADAIRQLQRSKAIYDIGEHTDPMYPHMAIRGRFRGRDRDRIASKSVLMVTTDDVGVQIAEDLFEMGVTDIGFIQPTGEPMNLSKLQQWDGFEELESEELEAAIEASDFVVYTTSQPYPELEDRINRTTFETKTPWLPAHIQGFDGTIGPAIYPGETACYKCFKERTLASVRSREGFQNYKDTYAEDDHLSTVALPAFSRTVAGLASLDLLNLLAFGMGYTVGKVVNINSIDLTMDTERVLKLPRCDVCGQAESPDVGRFLKLEDMVDAAERNRRLTED